MDETLKYRLLNSAPEAVYDVLRTHYEYLSWRRGNLEDTENQLQQKFVQYEYKNVGFDNVELELLQLSIPLINLALAQFGSNIQVLNTLFYNIKIDAYRYACLNNFHFVSHKTECFMQDTVEKAQNELEIFMSGLNKFELNMLMHNNGLDSLALKRLYSKTGIFENISQADWEMLIFTSSLNPSISRIVSRYSSLSGRSCNEEAWLLLDKVPVNSSMALALYHILNKAEVLFNLPYEKWMKRWISSEKAVPGFDDDKEFFLPLRVVIYKTHQIPYNSNDKAMRCVYYSKFECENVNEFNKYYEKDGYLFLEYVCQNEWLSEWSFDVLCALEEKVKDDIKLYRKMNKTLLGGKIIDDKAVTLVKIDKYLKEQKDAYLEIKLVATGFVYLMFIFSVVYFFVRVGGYILRDILHIL